MLPFVPDPRASLPRPLRRPVAPGASLAGVPAGLRERVGRNLVATAFPYPQATRTEGRLTSLALDLVELENARWLVVLCPTLGGRILRLYDRVRRRELLFQPPSLLQGVVGLAGAWFLGGVEFNAFRWGHNVHGQSTVETRRLRLADGTWAVELGAGDELFGCEWRVRLALGESQVFCQVELRNHSAEPQPDYWWTTIAVPAHRNLRILGAPGPVLHHGQFRTGYQHDRWPRLHGRDWSRWPEHHEVTSAYLYEPASDYFGYVDERDGFALVHRADRAICRGRKLWTVGATRADMFSERLIDTPGVSYLELQSGLNPLQVEAGRLAPGERRAWTESFGAITLPDAASDEPYDELFGRYEQTANAALSAESPAWESDGGGVPVGSEIVVAAAPRLELSARIIRRPESVTSAEVARAVGEGWVGGLAWREKLAVLQNRNELTTAGKVALAAAELDAGETDRAVALLRAAAVEPTEAGGWASYLLGLSTGERSALEQSTRLLPGRAEPWLALDRWLEQHNLHADRKALWSQVPAELCARDEVRVARAAGAHARGEWQAAREDLERPFTSIAEGAPTAWLIYRETFVAEALQRAQGGDDDTAMALLIRAGRPAPQFGMGRDENAWVHDVVYYRWRVATDHGRNLEAALLLDLGMQEDAYAGSLSAAYLARLAQEGGHPSATERRRAVEEWDRESGPSGQAAPLRGAVMGATAGVAIPGWRALLEDPLYRHRAAFELGRATPTQP